VTSAQLCDLGVQLCDLGVQLCGLDVQLCGLGVQLCGLGVQLCDLGVQLYDLHVQLTYHLHLLQPVRTSGAIFTLLHIHMWLTANMITAVSFDKTF
jgi:hypothetical protein